MATVGLVEFYRGAVLAEAELPLKAGVNVLKFEAWGLATEPFQGSMYVGRSRTQGGASQTTLALG